ncbi:MAG: CHAD domain-containing protein [Candidatus Kapaibacteriota bacterium]
MENFEIKKTLLNRLDNLRQFYVKNLDYVIETFDDEAIHDLRVSIRRILAFMYLIDQICAETIYEELQKQLKTKIKRFNKLRDVQVQIATIINYIKKFPVLADFLVFLKKNEKKQIKKLKSALLYNEFDLRGDIFFYRNHISQRECLSKTSINYLANIALNSFIDVDNSIKEIQPSNFSSYHKTRLKVKKFRYVVETLESIMSIPRDKIKEIQTIQTILGEIQDLTVLVHLVETFCSKEGQGILKFSNFVEFVQHKREEKEEDFWENISKFDFWMDFFKNYL